MYTREEKERALKEFERLGSVQAVVTYWDIHPGIHCILGIETK